MPRHHPNPTHHHSKPSQQHTQASRGESYIPDLVNSDSNLVHLDGSTLEGGGQLVRLALTLSSLIGVPIHIYSIRGNRSSHSSSKGRGLKSSHLAALEFLAHATAAKTFGAYVGSTEIVFEPGKDRHVLRDRVSVGQGNEEKIHEIRLDKPGSVWLILQAILPYIVFAGATSGPTRLLLTGGTNVPKSMSGEYVKQVMCPMFQKAGLPSIAVDVRSRGWTHGRSIELGDVLVSIDPLRKGTRLPAFNFTDRGTISKISISVLAGTEAMRYAMVKYATEYLQEKDPRLPKAEVCINESSGDPKRLYLLLVAHTSNGYKLGRDWLYDEKIKGTPSEAQTEHIACKIAQRVVGDLTAEIEHGGCVDEHMRDQLVVFEVLVEGQCHIDGVGTSEGSLHTETCRWVAEKVLVGRLKFNNDESCMGIGLAACEMYSTKPGLEENFSKEE